MPQNESFAKKYYLVVIVILLIFALAHYKAVGELCAGVAILLFGMIFLSEGFKVFSGGFLERILARSTKTSPKSVAFGTLTTAIMQSSSLVCVLAISFVSANLINLTQGIGVMFGANLGNTAGSWLIAGASSINISSLALPIIVGGLLFSLQKAKHYKGLGKIFAGLGFFFLGVFYIKSGFTDFQAVMDLSQYRFEGYKAVFAFLLLGAAITAIIQSSHATLAIIITAFLEQQISYDAALAAVLGTSVGGVVTALVASLGSNVDGKRLAVANCIFNFTTVFIVAVFFPAFKFVNDALAGLLGLSSDSILRLALFHTLFNLFGIVLFTGFIPKISEFLSHIFKKEKSSQSTPHFINDTLLSFPDTATQALNDEVKHLYDNAFEIIAHTIGFHRTDIRAYTELAEAAKNLEWLNADLNIDELYQRRIKSLFNAIMDFSTKLQASINDPLITRRIVGLQIASRKIAEATKNIGLLQTNIRRFANGKNEAMKKEYNDMRIELSQLLRLIEHIKGAPKAQFKDIKDLLKRQKKLFKQEDKDAFLLVEKLIRKGAITTAEGTSLLNDTAFINNVVRELISAINHIYGLSKNTNLSGKKKNSRDETLNDEADDDLNGGVSSENVNGDALNGGVNNVSANGASNGAKKGIFGIFKKDAESLNGDALNKDVLNYSTALNAETNELSSPSQEKEEKEKHKKKKKKKKKGKDKDE